MFCFVLFCFVLFCFVFLSRAPPLTHWFFSPPCALRPARARGWIRVEPYQRTTCSAVVMDARQRTRAQQKKKTKTKQKQKTKQAAHPSASATESATARAPTPSTRPVAKVPVATRNGQRRLFRRSGGWKEREGQAGRRHRLFIGAVYNPSVARGAGKAWRCEAKPGFNELANHVVSPTCHLSSQLSGRRTPLPSCGGLGRAGMLRSNPKVADASKLGGHNA